MQVYLDVVILLNFLVDLLLLLGTNRLCGYPGRPGRAVLSAALGGIYGGICLLPGFAFLGNTLWRTVSLGLMACIAFGINKSALRRGLVFALLSMALGGIAMGLNDRGIGALILSAAGVCFLCAVGFRGKLGAQSFVPVELCYGGKRLRLTALQDTGNTLRDPVTGRQVLVVGADVAEKLTGLTVQQLKTPVEAMGTIPGLRLIPYRTVGQGSGLLLALKLQQVRIGKWQGSTLVAFAPEGLSPEGAYQALTGGVI